MPYYDYKCIACGKTFEIEKGMNEKVSPKCPFCKSSNTSRKFGIFRRGSSSEQSGSCSSCSSGVCSSCGTKGH
ncbi:MAG: zinc ribbon domain-containing protein [bacterium]